MFSGLFLDCEEGQKAYLVLGAVIWISEKTAVSSPTSPTKGVSGQGIKMARKKLVFSKKDTRFFLRGSVKMSELLLSALRFLPSVLPSPRLRTRWGVTPMVCLINRMEGGRLVDTNILGVESFA